LNKAQVATVVAISPALAVSHIDRLLDEARLVSFEGPRGNETTCFRREDARLWRDERTRILFGRADAFEVADHVVGHDPVRSAEIADRSGRTASSVRYHLGKLTDRGLVRSEQHGRTVFYRPTPLLSSWWGTVGEARRSFLEL
jgi:DNA-binding transcriptional ArsR family regulator